MNAKRCSICDWKSENAVQLQGHMIKHVGGQYICEDCKIRFITKQKLNEHMKETHRRQENVARHECSLCRKTFLTESSLKQHNISKHKSPGKVPIGHPDHYKHKSNMHVKINNITCGNCGKAFSCGKDVDEHMVEHIDEFDNGDFSDGNKRKECRYFKRGTCMKGLQCKFSHKEHNLSRQTIPECKNGQDCKFFRQNRCVFYHPRVGNQSQGQYKEQNRTYRHGRECWHKNNCWKMNSCPFIHPSQDFQSAHRTNVPPITQRTTSLWQDY